MSFSVCRPEGNTESEFEAYVRLLRQRGIDIGNIPRVLEPGAQHVWLYVWPGAEEAQSFRDELAEKTGIQEWQVVEVNAPFSNGPIGPVMVLLTRSAGGLRFTLHSLSKSMIQSAHPQNRRVFEAVSIDLMTWHDYQTQHGGLPGLLEEILPTLTNLNEHQIAELGYQLIDADQDEIVLAQPPVLVEAPAAE